MALIRLIVICAVALAAACGDDDPDRLVASANTYIAQNDLQAATIQLRNALQKRPDDGALRLLLGTVLLDVFDPASASIELRKALQYGQTEDSVLPFLARAMLEQGEATQLLTEFGPTAGTPAFTTAESEAAFKSFIGQAQLQTGHPADAKASFIAAAAAVPGYVPSQIGLARVMAAEGRLDAAAQTAGALAAANPQSAEAHMLVSDLHWLRAEPDAAVAALEQAVQVDGRYLPARYALIAALIGDESFDAAAAQLDEARKIAATDLRIHYFDAAIALGRGDIAAARESSQRILRRSPEHVPTLVLAAAVELQAQQPGAAEILLRQALTLAPQHSGARRMLARTFLLADQPARAIEALHPLLRAGAVNDPALAMLAGEAYLANGQMSEASTQYTAAAQFSDTKPSALTRLGQIALASGDLYGGLRQLEQVAATDGAPIQADLALIAGHIRSNQLDRALQSAQRLLQKQPDRPLAYQLLASVYLAKKESDAARQQFTKALELSPSYLPAVAGLSRLDLAAGHPLEARQRFDAVIEKEPNNEQALLGLADVMLKTGADASDITATLKRAVLASGRSSDAHLALVAHYLRLRQASNALLAAQEAAAAIPHDPRIFYALGRAQQAGGQPQQALATFRKLAALGPQSKVMLAQMAEQELRDGNLQSAVVLYESVVEQAGDDVVALNNLAWAAGQLGDPQAVEYARRAVRLAPDNAAALDTLGSLLVAGGDIDRGLEHLRRATALAPKRSDIRLNYAKALIKAGKNAAAKSELLALRATSDDPAGKAEIASMLRGLQ